MAQQNRYTSQSQERRQRKTDLLNHSMADRIPPQAPDLEEYLLGCLMIEPDAYPDAAQLLKADSFYVPANRRIFEAASHLAAANQPIDILTMSEQLRRDGTYDEVGGMAALSAMVNKVGSTDSRNFAAKVVAEKNMARELIRISDGLLGMAYDEGTDMSKLMEDAESQIFALSQQSQARKVAHIDDIIDEAFKRIHKVAEQEGTISGVPSGFVDLDKITAGWQKSDLIIIAARPAMGKTAFVLSMAKNMAVDFKRPIAIFSLEMSKIQLANRLIMNVCEIEGDKIRNGKLTPAEWRQLDSNINKLLGAPIYIDDTPQLSIFELRSKAKKLVIENKVECIFIDYLQLMNATGMNFGSREQEVSIISRNLKALAKELDIPIIALSQLNRGVESRNGLEGKRPQLSDLRESGAIEQDADMVCFIHRPEYYKIYTDQKGNDLHNMAQIIVAKHRNGSTDDVTLRFIQTYAKFANNELVSSSIYDGAVLEPQGQKNTITISSKINDRLLDDGGEDSPF